MISCFEGCTEYIKNTREKCPSILMTYQIVNVGDTQCSRQLMLACYNKMLAAVDYIKLPYNRIA